MVRKPITKNISICEDECKQTLTIFLDYVLPKQTFFSTFFNEVFRSFNNSKKSQFR